MIHKVHVICWDGLEYDRDAHKEEIDVLREKGIVKEIDGKIIFDFTNDNIIKEENDEE